MNKNYMKGALGLAAVAAAIAFFLAYPSSNSVTEDPVVVATNSVVEVVEVVKVGLDHNSDENAQMPAGHEMIDRAQAAADNQETQENTEEKAALEINVIAD